MNERKETKSTSFSYGLKTQGETLKTIPLYLLYIIYTYLSTTMWKTMWKTFYNYIAKVVFYIAFFVMCGNVCGKLCGKVNFE